MTKVNTFVKLNSPAMISIVSRNQAKKHNRPKRKWSSNWVLSCRIFLWFLMPCTSPTFLCWEWKCFSFLLLLPADLKGGCGWTCLKNLRKLTCFSSSVEVFIYSFKFWLFLQRKGPSKITIFYWETYEILNK